MIFYWSLLAVVISTIIGAIGALLLKKGAAKLTYNWRSLFSWQLIGGGCLYLLGLPPYLWALKSLQLSVAYPLTSLTYIWSALLAKKHLNEDVHKLRWIGIGLIIIGITLIAK